MKKYIYSYEEAKAFVKDNDVYLRSPLKNVNIDSRFDKFNIDDYCEVVPVFLFMEFVDAGTNLCRWHFHHASLGLHILSTNEVLLFWESGYKSGRFGFYPCNESSYKRAKGFKYEEKEPRMVGTPTKKKIGAWVDYFHLRDTAERNYSNSAICRNKAFADKFKNKYPNATFWEDEDGWVSRFRIIIGALDYRYAALENGAFTRKVFVYDKNVPTTEELLK